MNKKNMLKNYIILFCIMISFIIVTIYILNLYKQYNDEKIKNPVITSVLSEIKYDDLFNISKERDFFIVYMCSNTTSKCRTFENGFKNYIIKNNLEEDIVYFNINNDNNILNKIYNEYKHQDLIKKISDYPVLLVFSDGKIIDLLSSNENGINNDLVIEFIGGYL